MTTRYRLFWHISPTINCQSILTSGLLPELAKHPTRKLVWFVQYKGLPQGIAHIADKYDCRISELMVFKIRVSHRQLLHHRLWIYYSPEPCTNILRFENASLALAHWENVRELRMAYAKSLKK